MLDSIKKQIRDNILVKEAVLNNDSILACIENACNSIIDAYKNGKKVLICGNGGSAADSQHIAAELVGRFKLERKALPAVALTTDTSILTSVSNDYNYDVIFQRQVEALGNSGDILIGISTSGNSKNISNALILGKRLGMITIGLLGKDGGENKEYCDLPIIVPSNDTPRIQETHIMIAHIICDLVEKKLYE